LSCQRLSLFGHMLLTPLCPDRHARLRCQGKSTEKKTRASAAPTALAHGSEFQRCTADVRKPLKRKGG
jgi:hypothetical protein